jgi:hypothetical protein
LRYQHGVNTFAYIRDMLVRVSVEPAKRDGGMRSEVEG